MNRKPELLKRRKKSLGTVKNINTNDEAKTGFDRSSDDAKSNSSHVHPLHGSQNGGTVFDNDGSFGAIILFRRLDKILPNIYIK